MSSITKNLKNKDASNNELILHDTLAWQSNFENNN